MTTAVTASARDTLVALLTDERLAPYLEESDGDVDKALDLYAWNASISAACMEVFSYVEVMLRNAIDRELAHHAGEAQRKLPWFMIPSVTGASTEAVTKEIALTRARLRSISPTRDARGQIIAGVSLGFWTEFFGSQHEDLWRAALSKALPGTPRGLRKNVTATLERLRPFRNRLAHHDSLLTQDIMFLLEEMLTLTGWISPHARGWLEGQEKVSRLYAQRPVTPIDTLIVTTSRSWSLYESTRVYLARPGLNLRPTDYIAFFADQEVKPSVARVLHHRDNVEWSAAEASRLAGLTGDAHRHDRKIATAITASRTAGWSSGRYQVFLLSAPGHPRHIELKTSIPRAAGSASFGRGHSYASHHRLQSATTITEVLA